METKSRPRTPEASAIASVAASLAAAALALGCAAGGAGAPLRATPPSPAVIATIPLEAFGTAVALSPDGGRAYVAASGSVSIVDITAARVTATARTGATPYSVALTPDGAQAVAFDLLQNQAWIFDAATGAIVKHLWLGEPKTPVLRPAVAIPRGAGRAYLSISQPEGQGNDLLRGIDLRTQSDAMQRGLSFHPGAIAASPDGRLLHVVGCVGFCSSGVLHTIDPSFQGEIAAPVQLASVPGGIAVSPDGHFAWVANADAGNVAVVDLKSRSVVATVPVGAEPLGVALSPDGGLAYVTTFTSGALVAIETATDAVVARAALGQSPRAIAITPDGRRAVVTHSDAVLSIVDLTRLAP